MSETDWIVCVLTALAVGFLNGWIFGRYFATKGRK